MSDQEKLATVCPKCGTSNTELHESDYNNGVYTDCLVCLECGVSWIEYFKYSGFDYN